MKKISKIYMSLLLMFLYVPIFVLIVFSFNTTKSTAIETKSLYFLILLKKLYFEI